jgi:hypothetical protein
MFEAPHAKTISADIVSNRLGCGRDGRRSTGSGAARGEADSGPSGISDDSMSDDSASGFRVVLCRPAHRALSRRSCGAGALWLFTAAPGALVARAGSTGTCVSSGQL